MDKERIRAIEIVLKMASDYEVTANKTSNREGDVAFVATEIGSALREAASRIAEGAEHTIREAESRLKTYSEKRPTKHDLSRHTIK